MKIWAQYRPSSRNTRPRTKLRRRYVKWAIQGGLRLCGAKGRARYSFVAADFAIASFTTTNDNDIDAGVKEPAEHLPPRMGYFRFNRGRLGPTEKS